MAETAQEMISILGQLQEPAEIFLDHDLGGVTYQDPKELNSGSEVVRWIVANKPELIRIVVHTCNTVQGPRMVEDLQRAGYEAVWIPFTRFNLR